MKCASRRSRDLEARGDVGRCVKLAFQAASQDVADLAAAMARHGLAVQTRRDPAPGIAASIVVHDPKGTEIELFAADAPVPTDPRRADQLARNLTISWSTVGSR